MGREKFRAARSQRAQFEARDSGDASISASSGPARPGGRRSPASPRMRQELAARQSAG